MSQQKLMTMAARDTAAAGRRVAQGRKWMVQGALYLTLVTRAVRRHQPPRKHRRPVAYPQPHSHIRGIKKES